MRKGPRASSMRKSGYRAWALSKNPSRASATRVRRYHCFLKCAMLEIAGALEVGYNELRLFLIHRGPARPPGKLSPVSTPARSHPERTGPLFTTPPYQEFGR